MELQELTFYVVKNSDGHFFRRKGYGGYGATWVEDAARARIFTKIGHARSRVTYFVNSFPDYPVPSIVEMSVGSLKELNEAERILKAKARRIKAKAAQEIRHQKEEVLRAQRLLANAEAKYNKLKGDT